MQKQPRTIYQAARMTTGLTQEHAAELLHISVESLRAYERGATVPSSDIVCRMIEIYCTVWLAYQHLKTSDPVGQKYLPDIECRDLPTSVLLLQKEMADTHSVTGDMIEVTCDGRVDQGEHGKWTRVSAELKQLASAALSVLFAPVQKEKPSVLAHRRQ